MTGRETPPSAILMMKLALGQIDAAGGRDGAVARHLNAAIEIALGDMDATPRDAVERPPSTADTKVQASNAAP